MKKDLSLMNTPLVMAWLADSMGGAVLEISLYELHEEVLKRGEEMEIGESLSVDRTILVGELEEVIELTLARKAYPQLDGAAVCLTVGIGLKKTVWAVDPVSELEPEALTSNVRSLAEARERKQRRSR